MGFFYGREDDTDGKIIRTGDDVKILETNETGFVMAIMDDNYMISTNGNVKNYNADQIEWLDW